MSKPRVEILCPVNSPAEVEAVIRQGATELYCGVLRRSWKGKYSNVASPNRREWTSSNMQSYDELREAVRIAHGLGVRVFLAMNGLYTEPQYPMVRREVEDGVACGVDALIIADIGLLAMMREWAPGVEFHISTGGTTFNSMTARFYKRLGAARIVLPRHLRVDEMISLARRNPAIVFEAFILNRGCKNIDGFCTFQHGVNEIRMGPLYRIPKKLNLDLRLLQFLRALPERCARPLASALVSGADGACFLDYEVSAESERLTRRQCTEAERFIKSCFSVLTGIDTCGVCQLKALVEGGITHFKIVGRENVTDKKLRDVRFLVEALRRLDETQDAFRRTVRATYRRIYGVPCRNLCYFT